MGYPHHDTEIIGNDQHGIAIQWCRQCGAIKIGWSHSEFWHVPKNNKNYIRQNELVIENKPRVFDMAEIVDKYYELLYAVARKFPNETRHETALRYIREAETRATDGSVKDSQYDTGIYQGSEVDGGPPREWN
jgi:hypothetical protein